MKQSVLILIISSSIILAIIAIIFLIVLLPKTGHVNDKEGNVVGTCVKKYVGYSTRNTKYFSSNGTLMQECEYYWGPGSSGGTGTWCSNEPMGYRCELGKISSFLYSSHDWLCDKFLQLWLPSYCS